MKNNYLIRGADMFKCTLQSLKQTEHICRCSTFNVKCTKWTCKVPVLLVNWLCTDLPKFFYFAQHNLHGYKTFTVYFSSRKKISEGKCNWVVSYEILCYFQHLRWILAVNPHNQWSCFRKLALKPPEHCLGINMRKNLNYT